MHSIHLQLDSSMKTKVQNIWGTVSSPLSLEIDIPDGPQVHEGLMWTGCERKHVEWSGG